MIVYYYGEDEVTLYLAKRLINYASKNLDIVVETEKLGIRERGEALKGKLPFIVELGKKEPIVTIIDSDGDCIVDILRKSCPQGWESEYGAINIAIDEGESWLLADKQGFSKYFGIDKQIIDVSTVQGEMSFSYKTSLYIMRELVPHSRKNIVIENLSCTHRGKKPPTYNVLWKKYIESVWDIDIAKKVSTSLYRTLGRIEKVLTAAKSAEI